MMQSATPLSPPTSMSPEQLQVIRQQIQPFFNFKIGDILLADGVISKEQLQHALTLHHANSAKPIGQQLVQLGYATEAQMHATLVKKFGQTIIDPTNHVIQSHYTNTRIQASTFYGRNAQRTSKTGTICLQGSALTALATVQKTFGVGSVIGDRFILTSVLGQSSMGTVFKAIDKRRQEAKEANCQVAIKVLHADQQTLPSALISLQHEARKTQMLTHANILTINDFDRDGDITYLVMEYLDGQPLNDVIRAHPKGLPMQATMHIVRQLADALHFAHTQHIIHCDFKPANVIISKDNAVKVIDFGIARSSSTAHKQRPNFLHAPVSGYTPSYATYQLMHGQEPSPSDDVYALACTTYKMLTGVHPFNGQNPLAAERLNLQPKRIQALSKSQWQGLLQGLSFHREDRTACVQQFFRNISPRSATFSMRQLLSRVFRRSLRATPISTQMKARSNAQKI